MPVFRHGGLRLYLLNLLAESPRHGYEVIVELENRFLGSYSPSAGTVYPRLAKLEAEGLITHELVDGKKVYAITAAGRNELADVEREVSASAGEAARALREEVGSSARELREELKTAARDARRKTRTQKRDASGFVALVNEQAQFMNAVLKVATRADPDRLDAALERLRAAHSDVLTLLGG